MNRKNTWRNHFLVIFFLFLLLFFPGCLLQASSSISRHVEEPPYEVVIENQTLGEDMPDLSAVEEAVNAITLPAINCTVKIRNIFIGNHQSKIRLMHVQNEKIDLINTGRTDPLFNMVSDHLLLPLDELLKDYGQSIPEDYHTLLDACRINGQLFALPAAPHMVSMMGFVYNAELADSLGITLSDYPSIEDLESAAEILKAHGIYLLFPNKQAYNFGLFSSLFPDVVPAAESLLYGILSEENGHYQIKNFFESSEFLDYCLLIRRWAEHGWIPDDYLTSGQNGSELFRHGRSFMAWSGTSPIEFSLQSGEYPFQIGMITTRRSGIDTQTIRENGWGISSSSENPQKAMEFLNFIYENSEVANLLMYGIEGKEYRKISPHIITFMDGQTSADLKYTRDFTIFGDFRKLYAWFPVTEQNYDDLQNYYNEPLLSNLFGYSFDSRPVSSLVTSVSAVLDDYLPALRCGMLSDVEHAVNNLNRKLAEAGMGEIITENQHQLDEWLSGNSIN